MAINDKDFYASHGLDFDYKNMLDEYIKGVINQAKIEVLTELQVEIEQQMPMIDICDYAIDSCVSRHEVASIIQQKINAMGKINHE